MPIKNIPPTMDIFPWPEGRHFGGSSAWWTYVCQQDETYRLGVLLLAAVLDPQLELRLLQDRDEQLMQVFMLSETTQVWLKTVQAGSLSELAQAILEYEADQHPEKQNGKG